MDSGSDTEPNFDDSLEMDDQSTAVTPPVTPTLELPKRFQPKRYSQYKLTYTTSQSMSSVDDDMTIDVVIEPALNSGVTKSLTETDTAKPAETHDCTESDLTQALCWIRHQLTVLKQEDKEILERFYEIRAKMNKFKHSIVKRILPEHATANVSSASDPSINNSLQFDDIDYRASSLVEDSYLGQFRERTVSMLPPRSELALLVPNHRRSKDDELL